MQVSSPPSQVVLQKFGFLIMAPIALILHGLFLLIPISQDKKAKEPEKKEELQPIDAIVQLPPIVTSANPTPKTSSSPAPIVQQQQQNPFPAPIVQQQASQQSVKTPDSSSEVQQLQKQLQDLQSQLNKQKTTPQTPNNTIVSTPESPKPSNTPEDVMLHLLGAKPCAGSQACTRSNLTRQEILDHFTKKFSQNEIKDGNDYVVGYEITDKQNKTQYVYFDIEQERDSSGKYVTITKVTMLSERITDRDLLKARGIIAG